MNALTPALISAVATVVTEIAESYDLPTSDKEAQAHVADWLYEEIHNGIHPRCNEPARWELIEALYALMPDVVAIEVSASLHEFSEEFARVIRDNTPQWDVVLNCQWDDAPEFSWNDRVAMFIATTELPEWVKAEALEVFGE